MVLNSRVRDKKISEIVESFRNWANQVGLTASPAEGNTAIVRMSETIAPLHERIGEVLRKLDNDEDPLRASIA